MIDQNRWALGLMLGLLVSGGVSGGSFLIVIIVIFFLLIATLSIIHHKHFDHKMLIQNHRQAI